MAKFTGQARMDLVAEKLAAFTSWGTSVLTTTRRICLSPCLRVPMLCTVSKRCQLQRPVSGPSSQQPQKVAIKFTGKARMDLVAEKLAAFTSWGTSVLTTTRRICLGPCLRVPMLCTVSKRCQLQRPASGPSSEQPQKVAIKFTGKARMDLVAEKLATLKGYFCNDDNSQNLPRSLFTGAHAVYCVKAMPAAAAAGPSSEQPQKVAKFTGKARMDLVAEKLAAFLG